MFSSKTLLITITLATTSITLANTLMPQALDQFLGRAVMLDEIARTCNTSGAMAFRAIMAREKVVIDLTASWCGPCKRIAPKFEKMAKERRDVLFVKVDIDQYQEVAGMYGVRSVPTFLFIKRGQLINRVSGADEREVRSRLKDM